jgi:hypothetical protein
MSRSLVVAGNYSQFYDWCMGQDVYPKSAHVKFVRDHTDFHGRRPPVWRLVKHGTWFNRTDLLPLIEEYEALERSLAQPIT